MGYYSWYRQIGKCFYFSNMIFADTIWTIFFWAFRKSPKVDIGSTEFKLLKESPNYWKWTECVENLSTALTWYRWSNVHQISKYFYLSNMIFDDTIWKVFF